MALATTADWPHYTDVPAPSNAQELLDAAAGLVVDEVGWSIERQVLTDEEFDGDGSRLLKLPTLHLVSVEEVRVDDEAVTDYRTSRKGMLSRLRGWPRGFGRIHVSFTHGYETVPDHIVALVVAIAARPVSVPAGIAMEMADRLQVRYETGHAGAPHLDEHDRAALSAWRLE